MFHARWLGAGLIFALALAAPVAAQDRAVFLFARGGGYNGLSNLDDAGTSDFKKVGFNVGGGVGVQVHRNVSVRGDLTFARNELRDNQVATGTKLNRFFYDAALQLQYPTASGLEPYLFAGGGAVTLHEVGTSGQNKTKAAGTFGLGFNYRIPNTQFGLFRRQELALQAQWNAGRAGRGRQNPIRHRVERRSLIQIAVLNAVSRCLAESTRRRPDLRIGLPIQL